MSQEFKIENNSIYFKHQRITFLTKSLVRVEYSPTNKFIDEKTQMVVNRDFDKVDFTTNLNNGFLKLTTDALFVETNGEKFSALGLTITLRQSEELYYNTYHYGDKIHNLKGTARTLDEADGEIPLEDGLMSRRGFSIIDDSKSMLNVEDFFTPRDKNHMDIYFFGYNHNYLECLKDFYKLSGKTPMIPRYTLGNWWSRYYKYTTKSYLELLDKFDEENIPFSVAVIDMDWHLVDIDRKFGSGWTGYTWNKKFFPDPKAFLEELHKRGLKVTLNDHPADGVRSFEDNYCDIAKAMNVKNNEDVNFDASDKKYLDSLQKHILDPLEKDGIDFWWLDWQQGTTSKIEGLDPLWVLNYHRFMASKKDNKRPLIFSRYAGPGSHRYPIGFSGDTYITWESLAFQPKFTICASNIGYGWWSHDIGGHMRGYKDNDLTARWTQFGVFSPIMRLHSSNEIFNGKEPWRFNRDTHSVMNKFLRLRHKLIPYLYTMNYEAWKNDTPLVRPMYYYHSEEDIAYTNESQYYFGSQMIVSPIVSKQHKAINMGSALTWLPDGKYYDFFTSRRYNGNRAIKMYRTIDSIPVLIKEGNIIVLSNDLECDENPKNLNIKCYMGNNGNFDLYEDDNISENYKNDNKVITHFINDYNNRKFIINKADGNLSLIPEVRNYEITFVGIKDTSLIVLQDGNEINYSKKYDSLKKELTVFLDKINTTSTLEIEFEILKISEIDKIESIREILDRCEINIKLKDKLFDIIQNNTNENIISNLISLNIDSNLYNAIIEILLA
ncbi:MAG: glycoside hydrolase family 31 protein [Sphaerochaetaceae bacterium]|nr:glycoside hydrolase family 31 protein [Sphaerochaetaceae bacterium]